MAWTRGDAEGQGAERGAVSGISVTPAGASVQGLLRGQDDVQEPTVGALS